MFISGAPEGGGRVSGKLGRNLWVVSGRNLSDLEFSRVKSQGFPIGLIKSSKVKLCRQVKILDALQATQNVPLAWMTPSLFQP